MHNNSSVSYLSWTASIPLISKTWIFYTAIYEIDTTKNRNRSGIFSLLIFLLRPVPEDCIMFNSIHNDRMSAEKS